MIPISKVLSDLSRTNFINLTLNINFKEKFLSKFRKIPIFNSPTTPLLQSTCIFIGGKNFSIHLNCKISVQNSKKNYKKSIVAFKIKIEN